MFGRLKDQKSFGCGTIVVGNFQVAFWSIACERQTRRLREALFRSILHKETSYFDTNKTGQLNTRLTEDVNKVHDGTGDKVGSALQFFSAFIVGLIIGLIKGWKLTLVIISVSPLFFVSITATMITQELKAYAKAGAIAEEPSKITITNSNGIIKEDLIGYVKFSDVHFVYPFRVDVPILNGLSSTAPAGHTAARVDASVCGKSKCMQLIQRFYDPVNGSIEIDGTPVDQYNLTWLR
ncbi:unnamed protein product [Rotaria sp. Silwood2]|nr:unnamed protein product [Rotaria sp. Silwood2]